MHRKACAIVLTRGDGDGLEVYVTLRSLKLAFMAGFHAFPGGTMAKVDSAVAVAGGSDAVPATYVSCAARELFEECGVVVDGPLATRADKDAVRRALLADESLWEKLVRDGDVVLEARRFRPFGRWVTPPFAKIRFDALYLQLDAGDATPVIWPGELDEGFWVTPAAALAAHDAGDLFLSFPVLETIRELVRYGGFLEETSAALQARDVYPHPGGEMLTGLHAIALRTPTLPPATHTNVYVLGGRDLVIVDPAPEDRDEQDNLVAYLERVQTQSQARLREIWLTHEHRDHVGAAALLRDRYNVPIAAHALTAKALTGTLHVDRHIADGDTTRFTLSGGHVAEWVAVHTPGHARGHLCFFEKRLRTLISGDLIASVGTIIVAPLDGDMADYFVSLRKVRDLTPRMLFPAHGPPVAALPKIDEYITHRQAREGAILAAVATPTAPADIVTRVYTDVSKEVYPLAEVNVRSHLAKLVQEGRVRQSGDTFVIS